MGITGYIEVLFPEIIPDLNKTSRSRGAIGKNAVVPRYVAENFNPKNTKVLDYGAGKDAIHTQWLRGLGFDVTAHEIGANVNPKLHSPDALKALCYDVVMLSNVVNVYSDLNSLYYVFEDTLYVTKMDGKVIFNVPKSPRVVPPQDILGMLRKDGWDVEEDKIGSTPIYIAR